MGKSLQDQFLKMGLVDKKKYNESKQEKYKKKVKGNKKEELSDMAKQALAEKKQAARQHNKKRQAIEEEKQRAARARQLIETHRIQYEEGEIPYNFKDNTTIKKIYLSRKAIDNLANGKNGIVKLAGEYQFVPADIIYKIKELNKKMVIFFNPPATKKDKKDDDPYAEFAIPDDLMW